MPEMTDLEAKKIVKEYHKDINKGLFELITLSKKIGFANHTAIWFTLLGVFNDSASEIERLGEVIGMYRDARLKELEARFRFKRK